MLTMENLVGHSIGVSFVTDDHIRSLNRRYRHVDKATDILSFPFDNRIHTSTSTDSQSSSESNTTRDLGDLYLSLPYIERQCVAKRDPLELDRKLRAALAHGFCHLLGFDHKTDDSHEFMLAKEEMLLRAFDSTLSSEDTSM